MKKSQIVLFLIICVSLLLITGCQGRRTRVMGEPIEFTGYPMNAKDWTVSWFVGSGFMPSAVFASADESPFHIWIQEEIGVNIDWIVPLRGTEAQALNLLLASRDFPDIIWGNTMPEAERLINEGVFRDLTPYMEKWAPNYWAWLQANPDYRRAVVTDSGRYFGFAMFREDGSWNGTYVGPIVNRNWLTEQNLPIPRTISDWDRTLRVFHDVYGATMSFAWSRVTNCGSKISGAWGAHTFSNYRLFVDRDRRVQLANVQPEFRNQLMYYNRWWNDGIMDQNVLTINDTMMRSNALNLRTGLTVTSMGQLTNWRTDAALWDTGADWVGIQYPTGDDGTLSHVSGGFGVVPIAAVITTAVPDEMLEVVMRVLDFGFSPEGILFWNFGRQGVSWDFNEDGQVDFLPLVTEDPNGLNDAVEFYSGTVWNGPSIQATRLLHIKNIPEAIQANDIWFYPNEELATIDKLPVGLTFTTAESIRLRELGAVETFVNEATIQFITGRRSFDEWEDYVARVNALGAPEILAIHQTAYERWLAR